MLVEEYGYRRIVSVSHCQIPQWGSLSTPYAGNYGKTEIGYKIEVDDGRPTYDPIIPESW